MSKLHRTARTTLALIAASVAAIGGVAGCGPATPTAAPTTAATTIAAPATSPVVSPGATPTDGPVTTPTCGAGQDPAVPKGGIPLATLCGSTIPLPRWSQADCPSGNQKFSDGLHFIGDSFYLNLASSSLVSDQGIAYVDVNGDGDAETVLLVSCGGESWISQVIVLDRTGSGPIRLVGRVVSTDLDHLRRIYSVHSGSAGSITVVVGDVAGQLDGDDSYAQHQTRTYQLRSGAFAQTAGPTTFAPNPRLADLATSSTGLHFGKPDGSGKIHATLVVRIANHGPGTAPFSVLVSLPGALPEPLAGCEREDGTFGITLTCRQDAVAPGATATLTVPVTMLVSAKADASQYIPTANAQVDAGYGDPVYENNSTDLAVSYA